MALFESFKCNSAKSVLTDEDVSGEETEASRETEFGVYATECVGSLMSLVSDDFLKSEVPSDVAWRGVVINVDCGHS